MTLLTRWIDPFIAALMGAIILALLIPVSGVAAAIVQAIVYLMIVQLFFFQGARLPRETVIAALVHWRLHGAILASTFILFPVIGLTVHFLAPALFSPVVWTGILFLCALPSTIQSSVAFVSIAHGNVAGAVAAATGSNIIGVVLTPLLLAAMIATQGNAGLDLAGVGKLVVLLLLPFALGQLLARHAAPFAGRHRRWMTFNDRGAVIIAVYAAFSSITVERLWDRLPAVEVIQILLFCSALLCLVLAVNWWGSKALGFSREDRITQLMCGTKKSLATGVPMASVLFHGPTAGVVLLPLLIFHQVQLVVCALIAKRLSHGEKTSPAASVD